jgi:hypothetical protein
MTPTHWFALCAPFCLCLLFDLICTRRGKCVAWAIIVLCLAYLSVKP